MLGEWDEALARGGEPGGTGAVESGRIARRARSSLVDCARGDLVRRSSAPRRPVSRSKTLGRIAGRARVRVAEAVVLAGRGQDRGEALAAAESGVAFTPELGSTYLAVKLCFVEALEAAFAAGDQDKVEELLGDDRSAPAGRAAAAARGARAPLPREADRRRGRFRAATALFRELELPFAPRRHARWSTARRRGTSALLAEAREIFERLGATPWLERAGGVGTEREVVRVTCPSCGTENRPEGGSSAPSAAVRSRVGCPNAARATSPASAFCGECGSPLIAGSRARAAVAARRRPRPSAGSSRSSSPTSSASPLSSEGRDAEDTRELLSRYFETCQRPDRALRRDGREVHRRRGDGGLGHADRDRGRRRAGRPRGARPRRRGHRARRRVGRADLRARAGVLTGEAAVTIGAEGQGMVAGDLVNTASRIQSAAEPGTVLVGEATRRATEAAVAYEDAGEHELKGKVGLTPLWRALRVVSGRARHAEVGRARGRRSSAATASCASSRSSSTRAPTRRKAHLVSVTGIAGIGKSRLALGVLQVRRRARPDHVLAPRPLPLPTATASPTGRSRRWCGCAARIVEEERPGARAGEAAARRSRSTSPTRTSGAFVEPRLAHLLGLEERDGAGDDARISSPPGGSSSSGSPSLADRGARLRGHAVGGRRPARLHRVPARVVAQLAIFVVTLARPELAERRPTWGAGQRNFTLALPRAALRDARWRSCSTASCPACPTSCAAQILARAEGVPLYAVETVRMLLDRGLLAQEGAGLPAGRARSSALEVPETLHALIAARLDGLSAGGAARCSRTAPCSARRSRETGARCALRHAGSRARAAPVLARPQGGPRRPGRPALAGARPVRLPPGPRRATSPTRRLSKHERQGPSPGRRRVPRAGVRSGEDEIVEVVAAHYLDAYEAAPTPTMLGRDQGAGRWRCSRAPASGRRRWRRTRRPSGTSSRRRSSTDDPLVEAELLERAGAARASTPADRTAARRYLERARWSSSRRQGRPHPAARVSARLGVVEWRHGQLDAALERMEARCAVLAGDEPDEDLGDARRPARERLHFFKGEMERAVASASSWRSTMAGSRSGFAEVARRRRCTQRARIAQSRDGARRSRFALLKQRAGARARERPDECGTPGATTTSPTATIRRDRLRGGARVPEAALEDVAPGARSATGTQEWSARRDDAQLLYMLAPDSGTRRSRPPTRSPTIISTRSP